MRAMAAYFGGVWPTVLGTLAVGPGVPQSGRSSHCGMDNGSGARPRPPGQVRGRRGAGVGGGRMSCLYLAPTGRNGRGQPGWGGWAGRYGLMPDAGGRKYFWANAEDAWEGSVHRENTLKRWAEDLQNDFRARLEWCVKDY